jgi:hypothetical protein
MFNFSTDSLNDYVFTFPTTPTPIVLEKVKDTHSSFDFVVPTIPTKKQLSSIQRDSFIEENESDNDTEPESFAHYINESEFDLPAMQYSSKKEETSFNSPKIPFITNIYVASLTVVGLFLLFRMIQK